MLPLRRTFTALRALLFIPALTFLFAVPVMVLTLFDRTGRLGYDRVVRPWAGLCLRLAGVRLEVRDEAGLERGGGPFIVTMNHQSHMDIPIIVASLPVQLRFVGKKSLGRIPLFGRAARMVGCVFIDRADRSDSIAGMAAAARILSVAACSFVVAPEGTRSTDGRLLPFKKGAFIMAMETGTPVLPVTIRGSGRVLPKGSVWARPGTVRVTIHRPVPTEGLTYDDRDDLRDRVRAVMAGDIDGPAAAGTETP